MQPNTHSSHPAKVTPTERPANGQRLPQASMASELPLSRLSFDSHEPTPNHYALDKLSMHLGHGYKFPNEALAVLHLTRMCLVM